MEFNYKPRVIYGMNSFDEKSLKKDPFEQFHIWLKEAMDSGLQEPNAMTLATVDQNGQPCARMVLLKELNDKGFVFYTNYKSNKSQQLQNNSQCALVFWWDKLERQVRIRGNAKKIDSGTSDDYFATRPRGSQIAAWASAQSSVIVSREALEEEFKSTEKRFADSSIPRPKHWGGYVVIPDSIEFWQGRKNRLHDRLLFTRRENAWQIRRLAP